MYSGSESSPTAAWSIPVASSARHSGAMHVAARVNFDSKYLQEIIATWARSKQVQRGEGHHGVGKQGGSEMVATPEWCFRPGAHLCCMFANRGQRSVSGHRDAMTRGLVEADA
jgi:hypothetical protein